MANNYGHPGLQNGQIRHAILQVAPETPLVLEAYAAMGASGWGEVILDDLVQTVLCAAMPRWQDLVTAQGVTPAGMAEAVYSHEIWMREGARQLVLQLMKAMHEAPGLLAQLREQG